MVTPETLKRLRALLEAQGVSCTCIGAPRSACCAACFERLTHGVWCQVCDGTGNIPDPAFGPLLALVRERWGNHWGVFHGHYGWAWSLCQTPKCHKIHDEVNSTEWRIRSGYWQNAPQGAFKGAAEMAALSARLMIEAIGYRFDRPIGRISVYGLNSASLPIGSAKGDVDNATALALILALESQAKGRHGLQDVKRGDLVSQEEEDRLREERGG